MIFKFFHPVFTGGTILLSILERRVLFIGNLSEEVPFYWQFKRGGTILLGKFGRRFIEFFFDVHNFAGCCLEFNFNGPSYFIGEA